MGEIKIFRGPTQVETIQIKGGEVLGRGDDVEIQITHPSVSTRHLLFFVKNGDTTIIDLNSSNGTYVNDRRIDSHTLSDQDLVVIGPIQFRFLEALKTRSVLSANGFPQRLFPDGDKLSILDDGDDEDIYDDIHDAVAVIEDLDFNPTGDVESPREFLRSRLSISKKFSDGLSLMTDPEEFVRKVAKLIVQRFPNTDRCVIAIGDSIENLVVARVEGKNRHRSSFHIRASCLNTVFNQKKSILSEDGFSPPIMSMHTRGSTTSNICTPLICRDDIFGFIRLEGGLDNRFTTEDLLHFTIAAGQVARSLQTLQLSVRSNELNKTQANLAKYFGPGVAKRIAGEKPDFISSAHRFQGTVLTLRPRLKLLGGYANPELVMAKAERFTRTIRDIVFKTGGCILSSTGEEMKAIWGHLENEALDVGQAMQAALEIRTACYILSVESTTDCIQSFNLDMGLDRGDLLLGNLNSTGPFQLGAFGSTLIRSRNLTSLGTNTTLFTRAFLEGSTKRPLWLSDTRSNTGLCHGELLGMEGTQDDTYTLSVPITWRREELKTPGMLAKIKVVDKSVLALIILPPVERQSEFILEICFPGLDPFELTFQTQRIVKLEASEASCFAGFIEIEGTPLGTLYSDGVLYPQT